MTTVHKFEDFPHEWKPFSEKIYGKTPYNLLLPSGEIIRKKELVKVSKYHFDKKEYEVNIPWEDGKFVYTSLRYKWQPGSLPTIVEYSATKYSVEGLMIEEYEPFKRRSISPLLEIGQIVKLAGTRDKANPYRLLSSINEMSVFGQKVGLNRGKMETFLVGSSNGIHFIEGILCPESAKEGKEVFIHDFRKV